MNQLLITNIKKNTCDFPETFEPSIPYVPIEIKSKRKKLIFFKTQTYVFSACILLLSIFYYNYTKNINEKEKLASTVLSNYSISNLYSSYEDTATISTNDNPNSNNNLIGVLEIPSLDIVYPVFNNFSDELLQIAPCKFYGSTPSSPR